GPNFVETKSIASSTESNGFGGTASRSNSSSTPVSSNNSSTCPCKPQRTGGSASGDGGGRYGPTVLKNVPIAPSGVHAVMPSRPPGRSTRASSWAVTSWRGANMQPKVESTTSKLSSSNGSSSASPCTHSISTPASAASARAASKSSGVRSTPTTVAPACAALKAALPVPQATS